MSIISAITLILLGAALGYFAARFLHPKVDNSELEKELEVTRDNLKQQDIYWQQQKADSLELLDQLDQTYSKLTQHLKQDTAVVTAERESLVKPEAADPIALAAIPAATESGQNALQAENETAVKSEKSKDTTLDSVKTEKQADVHVLTTVKSDEKVETAAETEQHTPEKIRVNS